MRSWNGTTGGLPQASWIDHIGDAYRTEHVLFAFDFNPGNASLANVTLRWAVDDVLGDGGSIAGALTGPTGTHSSVTTMAWNNVNVVPDSTNWMYLYQRDTDAVVRGIIFNGDIQPVPEPATLAALGLGLGALLRRRRRARA